jgi:hypothetical protein
MSKLSLQEIIKRIKKLTPKTSPLVVCSDRERRDALNAAAILGIEITTRKRDDGSFLIFVPPTV